jgi:hypothetical protein
LNLILRPDAFNDWAPKAYREEAARWKDNEKAWKAEMIKELEDAGHDFEHHNPTETAVKNMQTANARLEALVSYGMQCVSASRLNPHTDPPSCFDVFNQIFRLQLQ